MYRLDRIQNIEVTDYELDERERDFDPQSAVRSTVYAYTGVVEEVEMIVEPKVLNDVIDKFGTNLILSETDDGRIKVRVKATAAGMKYWALQYFATVEVIESKALREEIEKILKCNPYNKGDQKIWDGNLT